MYAFEFGVLITVIGVTCVFLSLMFVGITCMIFKKIFRGEGESRPVPRKEAEIGETKGVKVIEERARDVNPPTSQTFIVELDGEPQVISVTDAGFIGEKTVDVTPRCEIEKDVKIMVNNREFNVRLLDLGGASPVTSAAHLDHSALKRASVRGGCVVKAPVSATVLKVPVKVGDKVNKGDVVVILEVMKMENEVLSPVDGVVKAINVSEGDTVKEGDTLIIIGGV